MQNVSYFLGLIIIAILYFWDAIYPRTKVALFSCLKREFRRVTEGRMGYMQFVISFKSSNLQIRTDDLRDTAILKRELAHILEFEDFVKKTLSNEKITLSEFMYKWETCPLREKDRMSTVEYEVGKKFYVQDGKGINVDVIYKYLQDFVWDGSGLTYPTKEALAFAIDDADFKVFLKDAAKQRFKDYPLILICHLKGHFEPKWYEKVCENCGITQSSISRWHRDHRRAKEFDKNFPINIIEY